MLLTLLAAAVIITVIALRLDDGDRSTPPDGGFELPTRTFATWDEFLQSPERKDKSGGKVVFIGIDGAAWNIIDPI